MTCGIVYVATPYSCDPRGLEAAFEDACRATAELLRRGHRAYSPIAHSHPIAMLSAIDPLNHDFWLPYDEAMMTVAQELFVITMPGWNESRGIAHEIDFFRRTGKRIRYFWWPDMRERS